MKNIVNLAGGFVLRTVAAPVVVTGIIAQKTGLGIVRTGTAIHAYGEFTELKGLGLSNSGSNKMLLASSEFNKSREQRQMERAEAKLEKAQRTVVERQTRIEALETAQRMRNIMRNVTPLAQKEDMQAVANRLQDFMSGLQPA